MLKVSESSSLPAIPSVVSSFPNLNAYPCIPFFSVNLSNPKVKEFASTTFVDEMLVSPTLPIETLPSLQ